MARPIPQCRGVYVGGVDKAASLEDTRTPAQSAALRKLVETIARIPG
jgi:hypothetical protein